MLILWISTFQFLDIEITKVNPNVSKDETRNNKIHALSFGSYFLA